MSEWDVEETTAPETKKLVIGGEEIDVTGKTAQEVINIIKEKAREKGWTRVHVFVDGELVPSPNEFPDRYENAKIITVTKADVAG